MPASSGQDPVVNLDKLTYAGNTLNLDSLDGDPPICLFAVTSATVGLSIELLQTHRPHAVVNFAAESHVDHSIQEPGEFIQANTVATFNLLESVPAITLGLRKQSKASSAFCMSPQTEFTAH